MWCIPPQQNAAFVCAMENVLEVYTRPYDAAYPVICMDESSKQCAQEVRPPQGMRPGHAARYDAEYQRNGVGHLLMYYAPFEDWRRTDVAANHAAPTWAEGVRRLVEEDYPEAQRITLVMDNPSTHTGASLYKTFEPQRARALLDKLEFVVYAETRQLAEHRRVRVQRAVTPVSGSSDSGYRYVARRSKRLDGTAQPDEQARGMALYHRRCPYQATSSLPKY